MPAKISLTGLPKDVQVLPDYYRLSMEEGGTLYPPKGLPSASPSITYTVLVSHKLGVQLGLPDASRRLLIQGELTLDLPLNECPGEIGVIAFQGQIIPEKQPAPKAALSTPVTPHERPWPDLSPYPLIALSQVKVPDKFLLRKPSRAKTQALQEAVAAHGQLDEPIVVRPAFDGSGYVLYDGYRRYVVARQLGWTTIPVDVRPMAMETEGELMAAQTSG